jgi:hypothetical protein
VGLSRRGKEEGAPTLKKRSRKHLLKMKEKNQKISKCFSHEKLRSSKWITFFFPHRRSNLLRGAGDQSFFGRIKDQMSANSARKAN